MHHAPVILHACFYNQGAEALRDEVGVLVPTGQWRSGSMNTRRILMVTAHWGHGVSLAAQVWAGESRRVNPGRWSEQEAMVRGSGGGPPWPLSCPVSTLCTGSPLQPSGRPGTPVHDLGLGGRDHSAPGEHFDLGKSFKRWVPLLICLPESLIMPPSPGLWE